MADDTTCAYDKCKGKVEIFYLGKPLCDKHWKILSDKTPDQVKAILNIRVKK